MPPAANSTSVSRQPLLNVSRRVSSLGVLNARNISLLRNSDIVSPAADVLSSLLLLRISPLNRHIANTNRLRLRRWPLSVSPSSRTRYCQQFATRVSRSHGFVNPRASMSATTIGVMQLDPSSMSVYLPAARSTPLICYIQSNGSSPATPRSARRSRVACMEKVTDSTHSSPGILPNARRCRRETDCGGSAAASAVRRGSSPPPIYTAGDRRRGATLPSSSCLDRMGLAPHVMLFCVILFSSCCPCDPTVASVTCLVGA